MLNRIINERLTVRKTDEEIQKILNHDDSSSDEEKVINPMKKEGKEKMNPNDMMNNFNNQEPVNQNGINPGFMDVNKIENEARDINSMNDMPFMPQVEKQESSTSIFSTPMANSINENINQPTISNVNSVVEPAQMNNEMPIFQNPFVQAPTQPVETMNQQPVEPVNTVVPNIPEMPVQEFNPIQDEVISGGRFFNMGGTNQPEMNVPVQEENSFVKPMEPAMATPLNNEVNEGINPVASLFAAAQNNQVPFGQQESNFNNVNVNSEPVQNNFNFNNEPVSNPMNFGGIPGQPIVQSVQNENPYNTTIPNEPIINPIENVNTIPMGQDFMPQGNPMNSPIPMASYQQPEVPNYNTNQSLVEIGGSGIATEEPVLQPVMQINNQPKKADLKEAILLIRSCADKIEKMGFTIDVEELDFENSYQVSFKIDKD